MDFFTALLKSYEDAENTGWVDNPEAGQSILLPVYHTSLKSNGKNILSVKLDKTGAFMSANFVATDEMIVFPVTADSVARSGKNPAPHPLVDKLSYFVAEANQSQYEAYHQQLDDWIQACQDESVKQYLELIQQFIRRPDFLSVIFQSLFGENYRREGLKVTYLAADEKKKTVDLAACFLEFSIDNYIGFQTMSVTDYAELHQAYIQYVDSQPGDTILCNISGREEKLADKHRGLLGNAKLISVSNNDEAYKGRFRDRNDVFTVGNKTSEKIHLMAKFLLENKQTHAWLGSSQYLINWFDEDLSNESQLDITKSAVVVEETKVSDGWSDFEETEEIEEQGAKPLVRSENKEIGQSYIYGKRQFSDASTYYVAILNKTSNGRISLKYFRELGVSQLLKNLENWQNKYTWEAPKKVGGYYQKTPSFMEIILAAYGVDRDQGLMLDNDSFRSDQYQKLITSLLDGKSVPEIIVKKLEANLKQRHRYQSHWYQVQQVSLGILHQQKGKEYTPMLDHTDTNRSYLFGRLLAIFELLEKLRYKLDGSDNDRLTNAERYWTAYTNQPAKMMNQLTNKVQPYEDALKLNRYGSWRKLDMEREEIIQLLAPLQTDKAINQPLDYRFIFGYYAEKRFYYTKQAKNESED